MNKLVMNLGFINQRSALLSPRSNSNNVKFTSQPKAETVLPKESKAFAEPSKQWTTRKVIDAATVVSYVALVTSAIAMKSGRSNLIKLAEKRKNIEKAAGVVTDEIKHQANVAKGESKNGNSVYKLFNYFGKLKESSEELTNNLVYGFGTLVVMPLVILFSPFGKKNATKEDRTFTVLRQPISFATVFAIQLTFNKIFKSLIRDMNKYNLLDDVKDKDGKSLPFRSGPAYDELAATLDKSMEASEDRSFSFNEASLNNPTKYGAELEILNKHIVENEKGNKFTTKEFVKNIKSILGDAPTSGKVEKVKALLGNYEVQIPEIFTKIDEIAKIGIRGRSLKEFSVVIANGLVSQALGIMMLNVIYGKAMKKYSHFKESIANPDSSEKGGSN